MTSSMTHGGCDNVIHNTDHLIQRALYCQSHELFICIVLCARAGQLLMLYDLKAPNKWSGNNRLKARDNGGCDDWVWDIYALNDLLNVVMDWEETEQGL